jgi:hypothetical protein
VAALADALALAPGLAQTDRAVPHHHGDTMSVNLSLDLFRIKGHAQDYMRSLGITYEHHTPQTISDSWWFWNCTNVPEPLPPALKIITITPSEAVGYGLSRADADRLERSTTTDTP